MMAGKLYQVTKPFKWATREYQAGDMIELKLRSYLRHPTIAGKVVPFGIDSTRAKAMKVNAPSQAAALPTPVPQPQAAAKR